MAYDPVAAKRAKYLQTFQTQHLECRLGRHQLADVTDDDNTTIEFVPPEKGSAEKQGSYVLVQFCRRCGVPKTWAVKANGFLETVSTYDYEEVPGYLNEHADEFSLVDKAGRAAVRVELIHRKLEAKKARAAKQAAKDQVKAARAKFTEPAGC